MKTETAKQINNYVISYAERNNITVTEALTKKVVQNVIAWIRLKEGRVSGKGS